MKHITFISGIFITILASCGKKDNPNPGSYWCVNNDTIPFRDIMIRTAPLLTELRVISLPLSDNNMLSFAFGMGSLPHSGTYKVDYVASDPYMCNVYVTYNGIDYDVNPAHNTTSVRISTLPGGKGRYELEPTWFYKYMDPGDSILVKGVIIEP